jgi:hypothetical protein
VADVVTASGLAGVQWSSQAYCTMSPSLSLASTHSVFVLTAYVKWATGGGRSTTVRRARSVCASRCFTVSVTVPEGGTDSSVRGNSAVGDPPEASGDWGVQLRSHVCWKMSPWLALASTRRELGPTLWSNRAIGGAATRGSNGESLPISTYGLLTSQRIRECTSTLPGYGVDRVEGRLAAGAW